MSTSGLRLSHPNRTRSPLWACPGTWHDLRAVHGALLLRSGTDIAVLSRQLGHGSLGVTPRHYGGVADSLGRDAAERLERLLALPS
jgi:integrase